MGSQAAASVKPPMLKDHRLSSTAPPLEVSLAGSVGAAGGGLAAALGSAAAGGQTEGHARGEQESKRFLHVHCYILLIFDKFARTGVAPVV